MELLSTDTGSSGSPRTPQTKVRMWGQGRVNWNTEDCAAEDEGALPSLAGTFRPAWPADTHPFGWIALVQEQELFLGQGSCRQ